MCGIVGYIGAARGEPDSHRRACGSSSTAATTRRESPTLDDGRHRGAARRRQARQPRDGCSATRRWSARSASATRAGRRTAVRRSRTPTRTAPAAWSSIHNGIIENYLELRAELERARAPHRVRDRHRDHLASDRRATLQRAAASSKRRARRCAARGLVRDRGHVARREPDKLVAAKSATPIVIGLGEGENFVASDIPALLEHTRDMIFLEDGEMAELTAERRHASPPSTASPSTRAPRARHVGPGHRAEGRLQALPAEGDPRAAAGDHRHDARPDPPGGGRRRPRRARRRRRCWPRPIERVVHGRLRHGLARRPGRQVPASSSWRASRPTSTTAASSATATRSSIRATCSSSSRSRARRPTRSPRSRPRAQRGAPVLAVCNVVDSSIARRCDAVLYTHAGPRDRRRDHQGVHDAAHRALPARPAPRATARRCSTRSAAARLVARPGRTPARASKAALGRERVIESVAKKYGRRAGLPLPRAAASTTRSRSRARSS